MTGEQQQQQRKTIGHIGISKLFVVMSYFCENVKCRDAFLIVCAILDSSSKE